MANSYLNRTPSGAGNRKTFTISMWFKRSKLGSSQYLFNAKDGSNPQDAVFFSTSDTFYVALESISSGLETNRKFRDTSAWYNFVVAVDTTQGTNTNRVKLYVNGVQETSFNSPSYPSQNADCNLNTAIVHNIGRRVGTGADFIDGYMSHIAFVDGQALAPTVFGETDSTSGIWKFKSPSGVTWGTNGFHLKFENSGALGTDSSGNSNTFTVNGNLKQALDTPSNVYCTINPLDNYIANATLTNGNTTVATGSGNPSWNYITSTLGVSTGKWYWEVKDTTNNSSILGFAAKLTTSTGDQLGESSAQWGVQPNGRFRSAGSDLAGVGTFSFGQNDIVGIALDATNKKVYFHTNGTYGNSGNPSTGANGITIASPDVGGGFGWYFPAFGDGNTSSDTYHVNFGNGYFGTTAITSAGSNGNGSLFEYDVPSGYYALNTKNINTYG
jgi:hypothetical protein